MITSKIPFSYNIRSIRARFTSTIVAILGIAGVVAVFLAMLAMANGFRQAMVSSGSPDNVMIMRSGAGSEMESAFSLEDYKVVQDAPEIATDSSGNPKVTGEVVVIIALKMRHTGTDANVQMRGIMGQPLEVRSNITIQQGRFIQPGRPEVIVGAGAHRLYEQTDVGTRIPIGGRVWEVVGIFDAQGSSYDSEIWTDAILANETFNRPTNIMQSMTAKLNPGASIPALKKRLSDDPRLNLTAQSEVEYYSEKSQMMSAMITTLGFLVVFVMGFGAVFAALNTMSSTISARYREIATLRSLGFNRRSIVASFVIESILIAILGGIAGCLLVLPLNGYQASTMNFDTFSHLGFSLKLSPGMLLTGLIFAAMMGLLGGLIPATHAARQSIVDTLRKK